MGNYKTDLKKDLKTRAKGKYWKPVEGDNVIRVLPSMEQINAIRELGKEKLNEALASYKPYCEFPMHREVGPKSKALHCLGQPLSDTACKGLLCRRARALCQSDSPAKRNLGSALKPVLQYALQILVFDPDSEEWTGPVLWQLNSGGPKSFAYQLLMLITSPKRFYESPVKGYNINFSRTGSGLDTTYGALEPDEDPSAIPFHFLKAVKDWGYYIDSYNEDAQKAALEGRDYVADSADDAAIDDDEEDEPEERPRKKSGAKKQKQDEDEDELGAQDDEEDEEPAAPKKKLGAKASSKGKAKVTDDEDLFDDDEDGEEDETDEEKPRGKKQGKKKPAASDDDLFDDDLGDDDLDGGEVLGEDDEEDEPAPKKKPGAKKQAAGKKTAKKSKDEELDDDGLPF